MPLTEKGKLILSKLTETYGSEEKAKSVLYAGKNSGRFTGIDSIDSDESISLTEMAVFDQEQPRFKKTSDGYLVATPRVARTGIQLYSPKEVGKPDFGRMVRVYRSEDQVFNEATVKSFAHRPVTLGHPPEMVNDSNWKRYSVGHTVDPIIRDGDYIRCPIMLLDQAAIKEFENGTNQLSMGYTCDLKWEPGVTDDGEEFDCQQIGLKMNHCAVVANARGGEKLRIGDAEDDPEAENNLVHCPDCDAMIPDDVEVCPNCGYEMTDGELRESVSDQAFYLEDYNPNHDPRTGQFASGPGGAANEAEMKGLGYSFVSPFGPGGVKKHGVAYPGGGHSGPIFGSKEEAVQHAESHARRTGLIREQPEESIPEFAARAAEEIRRAHEAQQGFQPAHMRPGGETSAIPEGPAIDPLTGYSTRSGAPLPRREAQAHATAAVLGVTAPSHGEAPSRGPGRPRAIHPETGHFLHPRPGEPGYAAPVAKRAVGRPLSSVKAVGGTEAATSVSSKTNFPTHAAAFQHIREQRRKWRRARPVLHGGTFVAKRGFGFTGGRFPGLRRQVGQPFYTLHHDAYHDYEAEPYEIVFLDEIPFTDADIDAVELVDFNLYHDPTTGEFTSGPGGGSVGLNQPGYSAFGPSSSVSAKPFTNTGTPGGLGEVQPVEQVRQLAQAAKQEASYKQFNTKEEAIAHAKEHLEAWKRHHANYEQALLEIKRQQRKWQSATVFGGNPIPRRIQTVRGSGIAGLLKGVRGYRVHVDSFADDVELTDVDWLQAQEWEQELLLDNSSDPAMDEFAEPAPLTGV